MSEILRVKICLSAKLWNGRGKFLAIPFHGKTYLPSYGSFKMGLSSPRAKLTLRLNLGNLFKASKTSSIWFSSISDLKTLARGSHCVAHISHNCGIQPIERRKWCLLEWTTCIGRILVVPRVILPHIQTGITLGIKIRLIPGHFWNSYHAWVKALIPKLNPNNTIIHITHCFVN